MSDTVIRVENVSKLYRLGEVGTGSLAHDVNRWWHRVRGKEDPYLKIGEVNDRTKAATGAKTAKRNLTTEDTIEHRGRCEKEQPWLGPKGEGVGTTESKSTEGVAGVRLAGQAGAAFPNPSTSELAQDSENTSLIRSANSPHSSEEQSDSNALDSGRSSLDSPKAAPSDWVYALKDVSFEVKRGEVLGIIGRNGAGKSTLLKILSRVTTQSSGQIKVKGRIASLLEVGTGFHPELTGRENIFLNGAILGMRKAEIARKFDEIVEFSGCARRYIDTPVKRYSSGMYVRLAFAVAAHLEPEILIVDEVLAVGDAEFQKKCLGKMKDVAGHGRTILFVSHNMASLSNLCTRGIYMHNGMLDFAGDIESCIQKYLHTATRNGAGATERSSGSLIKNVRVSNPDSNLPENHIDPDKPVEIEIEIDLGEVEVKNPRIGIGINDQLGVVSTVGTFYNVCDIGTLSGKSSVRCSIPSLPLAPGEYPIKVALAVDTNDLDVSENDFRISVIEIDYYNNGKLPLSGHGSLLVRSVWSKLNIDRNH